MKLTRFFVVVAVVMMASLTASAHDFEVGGIYYKITSSTDMTVEVTYQGSSYSEYGDEYSGAVSIPESVTYESTTYSVTSIGVRAFDGCSSLTSVTIPESVTSIGDYAFRGCSSLTSITLPENSQLTSIGSSAFYNCSSLTSIIIPEGVTSIGGSAFGGCSSLTSIIVAEGNAKYDSRNGCNAIIGTSSNTLIAGCSSTVIPESVTSIGGSAFNNCRSLTSITIPEGVTSIGGSAFYNCSSLTSITIPESVTSIGYSAFSGCSGELTVNCNIPSASSYSSGAFYGSDFTKVTIGEGVTSIGDYAFYDTTQFSSITIGDGVEEINKTHFTSYTKLTELTLGKKVRRVEAGSFATCDSLKKVTVNATQPPTADGSIFSDATYQNATLYVPQGSISRYQVMAGWSGFYNMSEIEGVEPDYLTIRQADNGEVGIAVDLGRTYKVRITPSVGWQIHTVTLDGKDMTAQMADDNTFTTPTLTGSAVLNVAYVKEGSAIGNAAATKVVVRGQGGTISVEGAAQGEVIDIYTMAGALVASSTAQTATTQLTVPTGQVYIVTVGDMVVKIGM